MAQIIQNRRFLIVLSAMIMILGFYFSGIQVLANSRTEFMAWLSVISSCGFAVAFIKIIDRSTRLIIQNKGRVRYLWILSLSTVIITMVIGIIPPFSANEYFTWIYNNISRVMQSTYTTLAAFYLLSASYRAYKARSFEGVLILSSGIIILLKNAPITASMWGGFDVIGNWLLSTIVPSVFRAILLCASIGFIGLVVRSMLGKEQIGGG